MTFVDLELLTWVRMIARPMLMQTQLACIEEGLDADEVPDRLTVAMAELLERLGFDPVAAHRFAFGIVCDVLLAGNDPAQGLC